MQPQRLERIRDERAQRSAHVALPRVRLADPVADAAGLGDAAAQIGKRDAPEQGVVLVAKNQKRVSLVGALILVVALEPAAKRGAGEIIRRPDRLPRRKKIPALLAQGCPVGMVGHYRRAQIDALASDHQFRFADTAKERHAPLKPPAAPKSPR